jgi:hypothetical protein
MSTTVRETLPMAAPLEVRGGDAVIQLDPATGAALALHRAGTPLNWIATTPDKRFGSPFLAGTQQGEVFLGMKLQRDASHGGVEGASESGLTRLRWRGQADHLQLTCSFAPRRGPRAGLELDLNLVDLPTGSTPDEQCMPVLIHTADDLSYAYFLWRGPGDEHLAMVVDRPLTAWRIKYSRAGHHMTGFQLLACADDLVDTGDRPIEPRASLSLRLGFVRSVEQGLARASEWLGAAIAQPALSGGAAGARVPMRIIGQARAILHRRPDGSASDLGSTADCVHLDQPGLHELHVTSVAGVVHVTRLQAIEGWESLMDRCGRFQARHFQDPCGAFYRVIRCDTLRPDGRTFEGMPFGDPMHPSSCRSGEFGGFVGAAILKNLLEFGHKPDLRHAADRYIRRWALNEGREHDPMPNTICKHPREFLGIQWSAYHDFREVNFAQCETFFLNQLIDYFRLTGDAGILRDAVALAEHFITDHMEPGGKVICQNRSTGPRNDYTTVDAPGVALARLATLLRERGDARAPHFAQWACRVADYLVTRGFDFPTEGEACTEDGSISCAAWTLLHVYLHVEPKPAYRDLGLALLEFHRKWEMVGVDCRTSGSTIRFWETQYESDAWGPSINAGHGWTIWTSVARCCAYLITHRMDELADAYRGFLCVLGNVHPSGGIHPCFTPDLVPGTPHPWANVDPSIIQDTQQTSIPLGGSRPPVFSASGNHALIQAAECWMTLTGVLCDGAVINGFMDEQGVLQSVAPRFSRLALSGVGPAPLAVRVTPGAELIITLEHPAPLQVVGAVRLGEDGAMTRWRSDAPVVRIAGWT